MSEILGIGMSHAPHFQFPDENMADILRSRMRSDKTPVDIRDPTNWPQPMRDEWGDDEGLEAAKRHREIVVGGFRAARAALEEYDPDVVLIWGDDQYENFHEDLVPPFCVYTLGELDCHFFVSTYANRAKSNVWGKLADEVTRIRSDVAIAHHLTEGLISRGFDTAFSTRLHHAKDLSHAFVRTMLYLDYDQRGWRWPIIPFHVNCYGSDLSGPRFIIEGQSRSTTSERFPAAPAPAPWRCFDIGRATAEILGQTGLRVAVIGSSSWSHAFLTKKFPAGHPDIAADRRLVDDLTAARHTAWRDLDLEELRSAGQHELLNWICLAGAMAKRKPEILAYAETYLFNSNKCVALFPAPSDPSV